MMVVQEVIVVEGRKDTQAIRQAVGADTIETGGSALNEEKLQAIRLAHERRGVLIMTDPDYPGERLRHLISQAVPGCKHVFLSRSKAKSANGSIGVEHASRHDIREAIRQARQEMPIQQHIGAHQQKAHGEEHQLTSPGLSQERTDETNASIGRASRASSASSADSNASSAGSDASDASDASASSVASAANVASAASTSSADTIDAVPWDIYVASGLVGGASSRELRMKMGSHLGIGYANAKQFYKRLHMFRIRWEEFEKAYQFAKEGKSR